MPVLLFLCSALTMMHSFFPLICSGIAMLTVSGCQWSPENLSTHGCQAIRAVGKGLMPNAQSSGLWCWGSCLSLFIFHNRQNKLGFLRDLRLLHSWMAVLHYCIHIWNCSFTSSIPCQREMSIEWLITCAVLNFYNFLFGCLVHACWFLKHFISQQQIVVQCHTTAFPTVRQEMTTTSQ